MAKPIKSNGSEVHSLLDPGNCTLILIDFEPQMAFGVASIDGGELVNNVVGLAKAARLFQVPTILTTVAERTFSGPTFAQLSEVLSDLTPIDRTTMNCWEDPNVVRAVEKIGRTKLVLAGLWTEVCIALPTIQMIGDGYEVYVVTDGCGGTSPEAHERAIERVMQAGAVPMTWLQFMLELQRDWARTKTYDGVMTIAKEHAGKYGLGIEYARAMLAGHTEQAAEQPSAPH